MSSNMTTKRFLTVRIIVRQEMVLHLMMLGIIKKNVLAINLITQFIFQIPMSCYKNSNNKLAGKILLN
jgi:hypothetical protein